MTQVKTAWHQTQNPADEFRQGLWLAIATYIMWGLLPVFYKQLQSVNPLELVMARIVFSLIFCAGLVLLLRQKDTVFVLISNTRTLGLMALAALFISTNWLCFIWAVNNDHVLATSLAYYLTPLISVLYGRVFMKEILSRRQMIATAIAGVGVSLLLVGSLDTLGITLFLAISFTTYGLIRKIAHVPAIAGLTVETAILAPFALLTLVWMHYSNTRLSFGHDNWMTGLMLASGIITAVPLLTFAAATRRLSLSVLGFCQYIAPTMTFCFGVFIYHEQLSASKLLSFLLIWSAVAIFSYDMWRKSRLQTC